MNYDIIVEPCVPVELCTGEFKIMCVRDVFKNAHKIKHISTSSIFEEYGINRFLATFFMDMVRPKNDNELVQIFSKKYFDMTLFDDYINLCTNNHTKDVFNLFSKENPFYQTKYDSHIDKKKSEKINSLFYDIPSGTNHVFFYKEYNITPADCFRGLCAFHIFLYGMGGGGLAPGVNSDSPYYFWIKGKSLFQEIIINSISIETWEKYSNGIISYTGGTGEEVVWRRKSVTNSKVNFNNISLLEGLTYLGRRFTLVEPTDDDYVKQIYVQNASKFLNSDHSWRDPYCAYVKVKETYKTVSPEAIDESLGWLKAGCLYEDYLKPMILWKFGNFASSFEYKKKLKDFDLESIEVVSYGGYNPESKGLYLWWNKYEIHLYTDILENEALMEIYCDSLNLIKLCAKQIKSSLVKNMDLNMFYLKSKIYLDGTFMNQLKDVISGIKTLEDCYLEFKKYLYKLALETYDLNFKVKNLYKVNVYSLNEKENKHNNYIVNYVKDLNLLKNKLGKILK